MKSEKTSKRAASVDHATIASGAKRLANAAASGVTCAPVRDLIGPDDIASAYLMQEGFNARRYAGSTVVGRKIGATSKAVQDQLGVDQPDFGVLYAEMEYHEDDVIPLDVLLQPKAEAEVAFVLGRDLAEGSLDVEQCRAAVDYAVAALEIVDSRITGWDISFADTVADNASSGLYVLGQQRHTLAEVDPVDVEMTMRIDGQIVSEGNGAACLGDPLIALAWLARRAREFGEPLRAGQVILSGALGPMRPIVAGATVEAVIEPLGTVRATFGSGAFGRNERTAE